VAPMGALNLGVLLQQAGGVDGARKAYQVTIDSGHEEAPRAAFNLGVLLEQAQDIDEARNAYQLVIDSNHVEEAPKAAWCPATASPEMSTVHERPTNWRSIQVTPTTRRKQWATLAFCWMQPGRPRRLSGSISWRSTPVIPRRRRGRLSTLPIGCE
jgi:tetratricopeptide (TPR) repeat protein